MKAEKEWLEKKTGLSPRAMAITWSNQEKQEKETKPFQGKICLHCTRASNVNSDINLTLAIQI